MIADEEVMKIREFLIEEVNHSAHTIKSFDLYGDMGYVKTTEDFRGRLWHVINERTIPYLMLTTEDVIRISRGFNDALKKRTGITNKGTVVLREVAELLGWDYRNLGDGKVIHVKFDDFLEFLYPNYE